MHYIEQGKITEKENAGICWEVEILAQYEHHKLQNISWDTV
jgi:hypothetical protein